MLCLRLEAPAITPCRQRRWDFETPQVCWRCQAPLDLLRPGRWIASAPGNTVRGYHLNRLYAPWTNIRELIVASRETTPHAMQQFQNSDLRLVFSPPGGGLTLAELDACREDYLISDYKGEACFMGVDVGTVLHVVIRDIVGRLWWLGETPWEDLPGLIRSCHVERTVIDALPETHLANRFAQARGWEVWLAYYTGGPDLIAVSNWDTAHPGYVHINRTAALDATFDRFRQRTVRLPDNIRDYPGGREDGGPYYAQMRAPQRTLVQDAHGNWIARWLDHGKADHFAHAELDAWAAAAMIPGGGIVV